MLIILVDMNSPLHIVVLDGYVQITYWCNSVNLGFIFLLYLYNIILDESLRFAHPINDTYNPCFELEQLERSGRLHAIG